MDLRPLAPATDEQWRAMLTSQLPHKRRRRVYTRLPSAPPRHER